jgi:hypothetical protein
MLPTVSAGSLKNNTLVVPYITLKIAVCGIAVWA